jgi:hypothetical protein
MAFTQGFCRINNSEAAMPEPAGSIPYFDGAEKVLSILGLRLLAGARDSSKSLLLVRRDWKDDDPRRGNDILFVRDDATVKFFEFRYSFPRVKLTADYSTRVNITEAVSDLAETIDRTIANSLSKDTRIENCTFYARPFPDPSAEMAQFGLRGLFMTVKDRDLGLSLLFAWDAQNLAPAILLRFLCCAYTPKPWITGTSGERL